MGGANVVELFGHDVFGEFGFVAFPAEVGEVKVAQAGGHDLGGGFGGGEVGEVAVAAEDALLEAPGAAGAVLQHFDVVIGFEDEDVGGANAFEDEFGGVAEIGGEADVAGRGAQEKADRVLGIVGDLKGFDQQVVQFKMVAGLKESPVNFQFQFEV